MVVCIRLLSEASEEPTHPLPFLFPFQFASLHFLLVPSVTHGVTSLLATLCSQADSTPGAVSQAAGPVHGGPASLRKQAEGTSKDEHGGTRRGGEHSGFLSVASVGEQLNPALYLALFVKCMSHSKLCPTPEGLASPSHVQVCDLPPTCNATLAFGLLCLGFLGINASGSPSAWAHLRVGGAGVENLN